LIPFDDRATWGAFGAMLEYFVERDRKGFLGVPTARTMCARFFNCPFHCCFVKGAWSPCGTLVVTEAAVNWYRD